MKPMSLPSPPTPAAPQIRCARCGGRLLQIVLTWARPGHIVRVRSCPVLWAEANPAGADRMTEPQLSCVNPQRPRSARPPSPEDSQIHSLSRASC